MHTQSSSMNMYAGKRQVRKPDFDNDRGMTTHTCIMHIGQELRVSMECGSLCVCVCNKLAHVISCAFLHCPLEQMKRARKKVD